MAVLDHERLDVYRLARDLSRHVAGISKRVRSVRPDLNDQLLRAAASIPLNIAEGNGEEASGRRAYFFRIARSSAAEVGAVLDHMVDLGILTTTDIATSKHLLVRVTSMLVKLTENAATRSRRTPNQHQPREPKRSPPS